MLDGIFIVFNMGTVCGSHLLQYPATFGHYIRDPEGSPDFHQFSPGYNHFFIFGEGFQRQKHGAGIVVDHHGRFGAGYFTQDIFDNAVSGTAHPF